MKKYKIEIKWAFIFMGTLLLWMLLEKLAGLHSTHIDKHHTLPCFISFLLFGFMYWL